MEGIIKTPTASPLTIIIKIDTMSGSQPFSSPSPLVAEVEEDGDEARKVRYYYFDGPFKDGAKGLHGTAPEGLIGGGQGLYYY